MNGRTARFGPAAGPREHYDKQRLKGKGHHASVRSVAFKWIRILFRCWRDRVPYSEQRYLQALRKPHTTPSTPAEAVAAPHHSPFHRPVGTLWRFFENR
jgi:hypothetical protein